MFVDKDKIETGRTPKIKESLMKVKQPIIQEFSIYGLNGFKDLTLKSTSNVKIIVSENGSGKTTLLNTLYALLSGDLTLFLGADFDRVEILLNDKTIVVHRDDYSPATKEAIEAIAAEGYWRHFDSERPSKVEIEEMILIIDGKDSDIKRAKYFLSSSNDIHFLDDYIKGQILAKTSIGKNSTVETARKNFALLHDHIKNLIGNTRILYLPTYRRIERNLPEFANTKIIDNISSGSLSWNDKQLIHFGLHDVEKQLRSRADKIRKTTVAAFSKISGQALDGLLSQDEGQIPDLKKNTNIENIRVILGRLGGDTTKRAKRIAGMIESGKIYAPEHQYLRGLIAQLLDTYASTQLQEEALEEFSALINSYWVDDPEKDLFFDKVSAEVHVLNKFTNKKLRLDTLSSGEKQIISVLARLRLSEDDDHIVLIDEPELSLSLEWQQKFLVDVCDSPGLRQLIAITHSPFIFKNQLKRFAGELKIRRHTIGD